MKARHLLPVAALLSLALLAVACQPEPTAPPAPAAATAEDVRRLTAILDYVAADYPAAVKDGQIISPPEYEEQKVFVADARALAGKIGPTPGAAVDVDAALAAIGALVDARAPAAEVSEACRRLRRTLLDAHGVVLAPSAPPSRERGIELYAKNCVPCHGTTGAGDGPQAAGLNPPPRSFHDPEVMVDLSPARAFSAITDGIDGTGMASFGMLSPSDRWSLAFHVHALRHEPAAAERGERAWNQAGRVVAAASTRLAGASDGELVRLLEGAGLDAAAAAAALAFLRAEAPYRTTGAPLDTSRRLLASAVGAYAAGDRGGARDHVNAAYLDGFEPHEGSLRAHDAALVLRVEERFLGLRKLVTDGAPADRVEREALQLGALLDRAEETLAGDRGTGVAFVGALLVVLREGLEAALIVLLLLGLARRAGAGADVRSVHLGWLGAVGLGVVTWFLSGPLLRLGGANRELVEGVVALLAAAVLLLAGHWVLARLDAARRVEALKRRFAEASPARRRLVLVGLGFVAVYREAFEVVLFLRALLLDSAATSGAVAGGAAAGGLACVVLVVVLQRVGRRLRPGPLLSASGTLLCVLAVVLAGKGVRALQEAAVVGIHPVAVPRAEWIGLYPTLEGLVAQGLVLLAFVGIAATALVRARREVAVAPV